MLYIPNPWSIYLFYNYLFCNRKFVHFDSFPSFCPPHPPLLVTTDLFYISESLFYVCLLGCFRLYSICLSLPDLFLLAYCAQSPSMLSLITRVHTFLWLSNIPLCMCVCVLFPSTSGHLDCFCILTILNNTATTMGMMYLFKLVSSLSLNNIHNRNCGITGSSIFNFLRNVHTVFHMAAPVYLPTNSVEVFPCLHRLTNTCCLLSFW